MTKLQSTLLIFGPGYSARRLASRLHSEDWTLFASARRQDQVEPLQSAGMTPVLLDSPFTPPPGSHLLITAPPGEAGCPALAAWGDYADRFASVTYVSTTGVYGDLGGGWAFEWSPVNPRSERARRRVTAETAWSQLAAKSAIPFRTVRLPGIYGPGRSPFQRLREGQARSVIKPGQVFSRVHVDDIADGLYRLLQRPHLEGVFHLCDDCPAPPQDVTAHAAGLLGLPVPEPVNFDDADLSPMARSFYAECKRVSNARAKSALGWLPAYRSYVEGLRATLEVEAGGER